VKTYLTPPYYAREDRTCRGAYQVRYYLTEKPIHNCDYAHYTGIYERGQAWYNDNRKTIL